MNKLDKQILNKFYVDTINGQAEQEKNYEESSSDEDFVCDLNEGGYFLSSIQM
jgi:hypothetical protein